MLYNIPHYRAVRLSGFDATFPPPRSGVRSPDGALFFSRNATWGGAAYFRILERALFPQPEGAAVGGGGVGRNNQPPGKRQELPKWEISDIYAL